MLLIDANAVHESLEWGRLMDVFDEVHRGPMPTHDRHIMEQDAKRGRDAFILLPAWLPQDGLGVKLVSSFPDNKIDRGVPTVSSVYVWFDPATGRPAALMDGESLIFRKTAADSALGSRYMSRDDSEHLLMVGAGALAPYLVRAHLVARPSLKRVTVWNRTVAAAERMVAGLTADGVDATVVDDLDAALGQADIVCAATMAAEPLVKGALLKPGTHVDLIGSFTPEMREGDDDLLQRATVFVDSFGTTQRSGEFIGPIERGVFSLDRIKGDMADMAHGRIGRSSADEITFIKNGGGSHYDYFTAREVVRAAEGGEVTNGVSRFNLTGTVNAN